MDDVCMSCLELRNVDTIHPVLNADHEVMAAWPALHRRTVYVTWTGHLMATCAGRQSGYGPLAADHLVGVYLEAMAAYAPLEAQDVF